MAQPRDPSTGRFVSAGGGGFDLGNAHGTIIIDGSGVSSAIRTAQRDMDNGLQSMGRSVSNLGDQFQRIGGSLSLLSAPIIAFGAQGVQAASRFEDALKEIEVRAGVTTEEMERIRTKALEIGRDTQFSAGQGADAFLQLLTAGQNVTEVFETIDAVLQGAAVSGEQLGYVSDSLTDIMAAFQLRAEDSAMVIQAMSDASSSSSATFSDLVQGFQNVGGAAGQFGLSVRETAAILATFSENGIKGAEAGTQLRSMLRNLTSDTDKTQDTWKRLGISMFDATGAARPLGDVMMELRRSLEGMTDQERIATIQALGGAYGQLGLTALTTGDSLEDMMSMMSGGADVADVAAARMDTFSGSVAFLRGSIETFQINTLTPFLNDVLRPLVMRVAELINAFDAWGQENPELRNTIVGVAAAVAALGPGLFAVGTALKVIGPVIGLVGTGFKVIAGAAALLTSPLGLVAAAVAGIGLALDALGIIDLEEIFGNISNAVSEFTGTLGEGGSIGDALNNALLQLVDQETLDSIGATLDTVFSTIIPTPIWGFITDIAEGGSIQGALHNALIDLFGPEEGSRLSNEINTALINAQTSFNRFIGALQAGVNPVDASLTLIGDLFGSEVEQDVATAIDNAEQAWLDFQHILNGAGIVIGQALTIVKHWFDTEAMPVIQQKIDEARKTWENFVEKLEEAWKEKLEPALRPIVDWFRDTFQHIGNTYITPVRQAVEDLISRIVNAVDQLRILGGGDPRSVTGVGPPGYNPTFGQQFDSGGMIRKGDLALIGRGAQPEAFIAPSDGVMIPNFDKAMQGMGGITINELHISANSHAEGAAAAEGFDARMRQLRRRSSD